MNIRPCEIKELNKLLSKISKRLAQLDCKRIDKTCSMAPREHCYYYNQTPSCQGVDCDHRKQEQRKLERIGNIATNWDYTARNVGNEKYADFEKDMFGHAYFNDKCDECEKLKRIANIVFHDDYSRYSS